MTKDLILPVQHLVLLAILDVLCRKRRAIADQSICRLTNACTCMKMYWYLHEEVALAVPGVLDDLEVNDGQRMS